HRLDIDELLARGAFSRRPLLGFLDLLPVAEGDDVESALFGQRVEAFPPLLARRAQRPVCDILLDLLDHRVAVGPVGADRAGRPATRPADAVDAGQYAPLVVGKAAGTLVEGYPGYR